MASLVSLASTTPPSPSQTVLNATTEFLPEMGLVAVGAITVGAGILVIKRGWGFFKGLSK